MNLLKTDRQLLFLIALAICCFFPFLGAAHLFDWDELNFAESAREMLITKDYFRVYIDFEPFTEKPPLFFWLQALSMKIFGVNEFAARFPNAVLGIVVILFIYQLGKKLVNNDFGFIWAFAFIGSILPHLYFRSGIIDPVFNFFMFAAMVHLFFSVKSGPGSTSYSSSAYAGLFTGLAVLTKGPVGFLIVALSFLVYWAFRRFSKLTDFRNILIYAFSTFIVTCAWYGVETYRNGTDFLRAFIVRQVEIFTTSDAGHGQPFYYHFVVLLIGCFPVSFLALRSFFVKSDEPTMNQDAEDFKKWMIAVFCVVLTIFSISTTKIVHYSSMAYYPLTFLAAYHICLIRRPHTGWFNLTIFPAIFITLFLGLSFTLIGMFPVVKEKLIPMIKDEFVTGNLSAQVQWSGYEWMIGITFLVGCIFGWVKFFQKDVRTGAIRLFAVTAITVLLFTSIVVPKIEQYTQGANIRFFQSLKGQDVYVGTFGYKSYAPYFYTDKQPKNIRTQNFEYLLETDFDIPVYLSAKNTSREEMSRFPVFELIREENGFLFYVKKPKNIQNSE
ncbi:MAG: glycosyltransferase family 39 protein [Saprospiraceae bacterium]|nr:glycosyltransferase family 39 protein [Saprospiraceae bacterium]